MADGRLALAEPIAQGRHVQFRIAGEIHQDAEPRLVGEQLEDLDEFFFQLVGQIGKPAIGGAGRQWRFNHICGHRFFRTFLCRGFGCGPVAVFGAKSIVCQR